MFTIVSVIFQQFIGHFNQIIIDKELFEIMSIVILIFLSCIVCSYCCQFELYNGQKNVILKGKTELGFLVN